MDTPILRPVTPSSGSSPDSQEGISGTALTQACRPEVSDSAGSGGEFSGDTILLDHVEDQFPAELSERLETVVKEREKAKRSKSKKRPAEAAGAAPARQQLILPYPPELAAPGSASVPWDRQVLRLDTQNTPDRSVYDNLVFTAPNAADPRMTHDKKRRKVEKALRRGNVTPLIPTHGHAPHHTLWDHSTGTLRPRKSHSMSTSEAGNEGDSSRRGFTPITTPASSAPYSPSSASSRSGSVSTMYSVPSAASSRPASARSSRPSSAASSMTGSAFSRVSSRDSSRAPSRAPSAAPSRASSVGSRAPAAGDHPPTAFGVIQRPVATRPQAADHDGQQAHDAPAVVYGPAPFRCPLEDIELPSTQPLDEETAEVRPKVRELMEAIYLNPLSKEKVADLYRKYPRPSNVEVLHKTRLNEDVRRALVGRSRESVVVKDDRLRSLQWALQFAARPIMEVLSHISSGDALDPRVMCEKLSDALKLIAKASWKQNNARRYNIYAGLKGTGLEVAQDHKNHTDFRLLLGANPREQIVARQKEEEALREVISPSRHGTPRQGNSRGGQTRRHNKNGHQSRGRHRSNQGGGRQGGGHGHHHQQTNHHQSNTGGRGQRPQGRGRGRGGSKRGKSAAQ